MALFDVIDISDEDVEKLKPAQLTLLRAAQQKKDELTRKADEDFAVACGKLRSAGMDNSSLISDIYTAIYGEYNYKLEVLKDNLIYNMSLKSGESGGSGENSEDSNKAGYLVDYSLSYNERYVIVRNYYLEIEDHDVRMEKYGKDEIAKKYLGTYYNTLYSVLNNYENHQ